MKFVKVKAKITQKNGAPLDSHETHFRDYIIPETAILYMQHVNDDKYLITLKDAYLQDMRANGVFFKEIMSNSRAALEIV